METLLDTNHKLIGDTNVTADLVVYRNNDGSHTVQIYGWSSAHRGQGNTNDALESLRKEYPGIITVHDCGRPGDNTYAYWRHQLSKDRIDFAYDDDGEEIDTAG